jgi:aryl-alcohol dehydrogenase-like predicted oxidoreductase
MTTGRGTGDEIPQVGQASSTSLSLCPPLPIAPPSSDNPSLLTAQLQYSLLDTRPENLTSGFCLANGISLLPYGVLAGGFLSDKYLGVPASRYEHGCGLARCERGVREEVFSA